MFHTAKTLAAGYQEALCSHSIFSPLLFPFLPCAPLPIALPFSSMPSPLPTSVEHHRLLIVPLAVTTAR